MYTPQAGIFALGTSSHAYLEFDILDAKKRKEFASTISAIREPRTTTGGVNFVIGFRPELWRDIVPDDIPADVESFNQEIQGTEGLVMPATQHESLPLYRCLKPHPITGVRPLANCKCCRSSRWCITAVAILLEARAAAIRQGGNRTTRNPLCRRTKR